MARVPSARTANGSSRHRRAGAVMLLAFAAVALAADQPSDAQIRAAIISASIAAYPGNCPCPYHLDRAGRACGKRSAWSRGGGHTPICYPNEVSAQQVIEYRKANRS